ncbi:MAG: NADH-quinone oxidoreductase subunit G [Pseudohongiellaceae bacterium]|jgi:NADH-quinone oxidoreductase subunit G
MAKIVIDGITYQVNPGNNLLQESLSQGLNLPYFCWHPCMGSVGACRQCAVKQYRDENDENGMIVMACMTPATDGTIISIEDEQAKKMRGQVIESLMISHPHDCPVCEEGGECHLQDMTQMSGHNYRRYDKKKVTHRNQHLGPFINHEMNRCITCYRCVRYYDDYAGGTDLSAQASHHHVYFGRQEDGVLENEFSGNLVEVCPTGVFTDKPFSKRYSRKWDLQVAPSICTGCAVGCNTSPGERYGELRRIVNRYNSEVNGYFLCDRGRFGFDFVNSENRITAPFKRNKDGRQWIEGVEADDAKASIANLKNKSVLGIGSPRASNESNFALLSLVGKENFFAGYSDVEHESMQLINKLMQDSTFHSPSIKEIEQADAILILGEDVTNVAPRIALALRQSVRQRAQELAAANNIPQWQDAAVRELAQRELSPLTALTPYATRLEDVTTHSIVDSMTCLISLAQSIASEICAEAPGPSKPNTDASDLIAQIASELINAKRPLIIAGSTAGDPATIKVAANIARALSTKRSKATDLCLLSPEVNSVGLSLMVNPENSLGKALELVRSGEVKNIVVLENDLYRRASTALVDLALDKAEMVVVADHLPTPTTDQASLVLPSTAFSEHEASYVNFEGRAQLSYQVHRCHSDALPAWRWFMGAGTAHVNDLITQCAAEVPGLTALSELISGTDFIAGIKVPRQSHRYSGRTAMKANINVHEPKQAVDEESQMSFSMEGVPSTKDSNILASSWAPSWNSNQSISKFQEEVNGELKQGHPGSQVFVRTSTPLSYFEISNESSVLASDLNISFAHQIFGSDELSAKAAPIAERMTTSYIGVSLEDAQMRDLAQGNTIKLGESSATATVIIRSKQKVGTAALYCAPGEINPFDITQICSISKADSKQNADSLYGLQLSDRWEDD